jgi:hypothetical protein
MKDLIFKNVAPVTKIEVYMEVELQLHTFLTLALVGDEWSVSHFG